MAWYRTGTASVANGSTAVSGATTGWLSQAKAGDGITFNGGATWYEVAAVGGNTALTLATAYAGTTVTNGAYAIDRRSPKWTLSSDLALAVADLLAKATHILQGAGAPTASDGVDGDVWIRTSPLTFYGPKSGGAWPSGVALTGQGLPTGGSDGDVLIKDTGVNYQTRWGKRREVLTGNRTYYVRPDGNDANDGLADTSGGAFLTISKAAAVALYEIDGRGHLITVQVRTGTYNEAVVMSVASDNNVVFTGDDATPSNVVVNGTASGCFQVSNYANIAVRGFKLANAVAGGTGFLAFGFGSISFLNCEFGTFNGGSQILAQGPGAAVAATGAYTISGGGGRHWLVQRGGTVMCVGRAVTLTGTPNFTSAFAGAESMSRIVCNSSTFTGSATGKRYSSENNSTIFTNGGGASFLPGSVAGTSVTGTYE